MSTDCSVHLEPDYNAVLSALFVLACKVRHEAWHSHQKRVVVQGDTPELVVSTAMASPPADVQPSTRDDQENALEWLDPINGNANSRLQSSKSLIKDAVMQAMNKINLAKVPP